MRAGNDGGGESPSIAQRVVTSRSVSSDVFVDAVDAEHRFKLSIWDEGIVQQNAAVIELLVLGKEEAQRVRAGEHDLHAAGREHVREQHRAFNKILHQRHFIEEHIAEALRFQQLEIAVYINHFMLQNIFLHFMLYIHPSSELRQDRCLIGQKYQTAFRLYHLYVFIHSNQLTDFIELYKKYFFTSQTREHFKRSF